MQLSKLVIAALSLSALTAFAESPAASGQYASSVAPTQATRTQVQGQFAEYRAAGVNPWSTSFNPLKGFQSQRTRAEVTAEYVRSRAAAQALTAEDSGSAFLAARRGTAADAVSAD